MKLTQELLERAVDCYNQVTRSHKKPIALRYIEKQLQAGDTAELPVATRWTSTVQFSGTPDDVQVTFLINKSVPDSFRPALNEMKQKFDELFT